MSTRFLTNGVLMLAGGFIGAESFGDSTGMLPNLG